MNTLGWLADGYGGKRAFLRYLASRAETALGRHAAWLPDLSGVSRLVFVCKGNICRSPFAEHAARARGLHTISAGLNADPGRPAERRAIEAASARGVNLARHRSRAMEQLSLQDADLLLAFEPHHAMLLRALTGNGARIALLGLYAAAPCPYLHDPYGLSARYFDNCFERIEDGLRGLEERLG